MAATRDLSSQKKRCDNVGHVLYIHMSVIIIFHLWQSLNCITYAVIIVAIANYLLRLLHICDNICNSHHYSLIAEGILNIILKLNPSMLLTKI